MERRFKREISALDDIFKFVNDFVEENSIDETNAFSAKLIIEELFTNLVRHNTGGLDYIDIILKKEAGRLIIQLMDFDVEPFDITKTHPVDVSKPLDERSVGGLGIHLVKNSTDKLTYEYKNRTSHITAIKNLEGKDV